MAFSVPLLTVQTQQASPFGGILELLSFAALRLPILQLVS